MDEPAHNALVEFRDVSFRHGSASAAVISHLTFSVQRGETLVLLGKSGCGKTTTLKLINRLLVPTSGQVLVEGRSTTDWDPIRLRRQTGYVIQEGGLFPHFSVGAKRCVSSGAGAVAGLSYTVACERVARHDRTPR